jgi:hypothetical protein
MLSWILNLHSTGKKQVTISAVRKKGKFVGKSHPNRCKREKHKIAERTNLTLNETAFPNSRVEKDGYKCLNKSVHMRFRSFA